MKELYEKMLWSEAAPSCVAEGILRQCHRPTIIPAPVQPGDGEFEAYEQHLVCNGVGKYFSTMEICTPNDQALAKSCGYGMFVPPQHTWGISTLLVWMADQMRDAAGSPVAMRNHWRPQSYNTLVGGKGLDGDHPNACGIDLDFDTGNDRSRAELWLAEWVYNTKNYARVSVGLGGRSMHVGVLSPKGSRWWEYESYNEVVPAAFREMKDYGVKAVAR
jgi:hypothetical protein